MTDRPQRRILVLGSSGLIGSALVKKLRDKGLDVIEYDIRRSLAEDLTHNGYTHQLQHEIWQADFVYFLAFDVGGAKYLGHQQKTFNFIHSNMKMMVNVFDALNLCKTPFIFSSSMMARLKSDTTYGDLKRLGEAYTFANGAPGVNVRFWNVYGYEVASEKSHVIADFCHQAATKGKIEMLTDGEEMRQFIYVDDAAEALETIRENWYATQIHSRPQEYDISNGQWVKISSVAQKIAKEFGGIPVIPANVPDRVQHDARLEPDLSHIMASPFSWRHKITLTQGIKLVVKETKECQQKTK